MKSTQQISKTPHQVRNWVITGQRNIYMKFLKNQNDTTH